MRIAVGLLGSIGIMGGLGWAAFAYVAAGMADGHYEAPVGELIIGGAIAAVGGVLLAGAIAG